MQDIHPEATKQPCTCQDSRARRCFVKWSQFRLSTALASWTPLPACWGIEIFEQVGKASTVSLTYRQQQWQILTNPGTWKGSWVVLAEGNMDGSGPSKKGYTGTISLRMWWSPHHWRFSRCCWALDHLIWAAFPMKCWTRWSSKIPSMLSCPRILCPQVLEDSSIPSLLPEAHLTAQPIHQPVLNSLVGGKCQEHTWSSH